MKTLKVLIAMCLLGLTACDSSGGGGGSASSSGTSAPALDSPSLDQPNKEPAAKQPENVTCAPLVGTDWVIKDDPTLTPASVDQAGQAPYVIEFDMTQVSPTFTENQWVDGFGTLTCLRSYDDGQEQADGSIEWFAPNGECSSVSQWIKFDATTTCNVLTVQVLDGSGDVYETATYAPKN